jgi:shikimate kinase
MGAISIVNAVASGRGASLAVKLPTFARVEAAEGKGYWTVIRNGRHLKSPLAVNTVTNAISMLGMDPEKYGGTVTTWSKVPSGVGLKTSSSSSVAIALATLVAFGEHTYDADEVLRCSASSSLAAGVSLTGAYDDAASCLMGGVNFADNSARKVISSSRLGRTLKVLVKIPGGRSRRNLVRKTYLRKFSGVADSIFLTGKGGKTWKAMTLNGLLYSSIYGYPPHDAVRALSANALGAGLSGTGPAVAAVFNRERDLQLLAKDWGEGGATLIKTETSNGGAVLGI